jgi:hypothetical protein
MWGLLEELTVEEGVLAGEWGIEQAYLFGCPGGVGGPYFSV